MRADLSVPGAGNTYGLGVGTNTSSAVKIIFTADEVAELIAEDRAKRPFRTRSKAPKREVEMDDYMAAAARFIRAAGRRAAEGDENHLRALLAFGPIYSEAVKMAVLGIAERWSWAYVARATGKTREAAYQRWGKK